ncbi:MAG: F-box protein [Parachlamydia sp.]|nr:F-box protein [Parachlamydia sp.]
MEPARPSQVATSAKVQNSLYLALNLCEFNSGNGGGRRPRDILIQVFALLTLRELGGILRLCKHWRGVACQELTRRTQDSKSFVKQLLAEGCAKGAFTITSRLGGMLYELTFNKAWEQDNFQLCLAIAERYRFVNEAQMINHLVSCFYRGVPENCTRILKEWLFSVDSNRSIAFELAKRLLPAIAKLYISRKEFAPIGMLFEMARSQSPQLLQSVGWREVKDSLASAKIFDLLLDIEVLGLDLVPEDELVGIMEQRRQRKIQKKHRALCAGYVNPISQSPLPNKLTHQQRELLKDYQRIVLYFCQQAKAVEVLMGWLKNSRFDMRSSLILIIRLARQLMQLDVSLKPRAAAFLNIRIAWERHTIKVLQHPAFYDIAIFEVQRCGDFALVCVEQLMHCDSWREAQNILFACKNIEESQAKKLQAQIDRSFAKALSSENEESLISQHEMLDYYASMQFSRGSNSCNLSK